MSVLITAERLTGLQFTRNVMEDEIEFRQTGSYPVYYEREFSNINREVCVYREGAGNWKASVSRTDGDLLYHLTESGVLAAIIVFERADYKVGKLMEFLRQKETTFDKI